MAIDTTQAAPAETYEDLDSAGEWQPETPFEQRFEFIPETPVASESEPWTRSLFETPFVSEYGREEEGSSFEADSFRELLFDLYDTELDRALGEMVQEAAAAVAEQGQIAGELSTEGTERFLENWIDPVRERATGMLDNLAEDLAGVDAQSLTETEIDRIFEQHEPRETGLEAHFEQFLGSLWKKAKSAVSGVVNIAKKGIAMATKLIPGLSGLLNKLKQLVNPLLERVLRIAMDQLPPQLRPAAQMLARRFIPGFKGETEADLETEGPGQAAVPDVTVLQRELDYAVASLALVGDEAEQETILAELAYEADREDETALANYYEARANLADQLEQGQDPRQALEQFIPAVMAILPIVRTVIGIIGRQKVVSFIAGYVAKLIGPYVGPGPSKALSQAIVDVGLRMISLEAPGEQETRQLGPEALVGTVEDTLRRVSELDEAVFEDAHLLEAAVNEAFQEAAAENFPTTELVPEVQEAANLRAVWVSMPRRGRRKYYKKYSHVFDVEITPQMAQSVRTFGGKTLAAFLQDKLGVKLPVRARISLYQTLPSGWPSRIAAGERIAPGARARVGVTQLHPLTPEAASLLLQQPRLGRALAGRFVGTRNRPAIGQRLYSLRIAGVAPSAGRRSSEANVALDFRAGEYRVSLFLGESDAQQISAKLRRRDVAGALAIARRMYADGVRTALNGDLRRHIKIRSEAFDHEDFLGGALRRLSPTATDALRQRLAEWVGQALSAYFQAKAGEFIAATEDPAEGVTTIVTMKSPPGAGLAGQLLGRGAAGANGTQPAQAFRGSPTFDVRTVAGFRFE